MVTDSIISLLEKYIDLKVSSGQSHCKRVTGLSEEEIRSCEKALGMVFPNDYRQFLLFMGRSADANLGFDIEWSVDSAHALLERQYQADDILQRGGAGDDVVSPDDLVFSVYEDCQFLFFVMKANRANPPVHLYFEGHSSSEFVSDSFKQYISNCISEKEKYIESNRAKPNPWHNWLRWW